MTTSQGLNQLMAVAARLAAGETVSPLTIREFLSWFGAKRRGTLVVAEIYDALKKASLYTDPEFEAAYIDGLISLKELKAPAVLPSQPPQTTPVFADLQATWQVEGASAVVPPEPVDPTHRISKLAAANNRPISVQPTAPLQQAITLMLSHGFSQLPVMTTPREVKGAISWQSIGSRLGLSLSGQYVQDMMEQPQEVGHDASIFQVIPLIVAHDYVLVRGRNNVIWGIVTASDLSIQFRQLSEPFLLLSEIENQIRQLLSLKFQPEDFAAVKDPSDTSRSIERVSDLSFGEYIRLLENPDNWSKLGIPLDRVVVCERLAVVRDIRNDVMHFDPDGILPAEVETLREFSRFIQKIFSLGVLGK